jgi:IS4 transposase
VGLDHGKVHEVKVAQTLNLSRERLWRWIGLWDYRLFDRGRTTGLVRHPGQEEHAVSGGEESGDPPTGTILKDQEIVVTGYISRQKCPHRLRRIEVWDPKKERVIVLLTNHMDFAASTISRIYKDRWQIELFFKAIKQNLKIKTFVGTSENAVKVQIWTALLCMLLLKMLQCNRGLGGACRIWRPCCGLTC